MKALSPKNRSRRQNQNEKESKTKPNVLISGWILKRKRSKSVIGFKWNKRWFAVESDNLVWYLGKRRSSKTSFPSGSIPLDEIQQIYKLNTVTEKEQHVFVVKARKQSLCLGAKSSGDCDKWVRLIQMQLDLRSGGTVSGPKSAKNRRVSNGGGDNLDQRLRAIERQLSDLSSTCDKNQESFSYGSINEPITNNIDQKLTMRKDGGDQDNNLSKIYSFEQKQRYRRQRSVSSLNSLGRECKSESIANKKTSYLVSESKEEESWRNNDYLENIGSVSLSSESSSLEEDESLSVTSIQEISDDDVMLFSRSDSVPYHVH